MARHALSNHLRRRARNGRRWRTGIVVLLALLLGCQGGQTTRSRRSVSGPLLPVSGQVLKNYGSLRQWWQWCQNENATSMPPVRQLILRYMGDRREFHQPAGPDGYLLCVTPLDRKLDAVPVLADVSIGLFEMGTAGQDADRLPLRVWRVGRDDLSNYWTETNLLNGYVFPVDWGERPVARGEYLLYVIFGFGSQDDFVCLCEVVVFEDLIPREAPDWAAPIQEESNADTNP